MSTKFCLLAVILSLGVTLLGGSLHSPGFTPDVVPTVGYRAQSAPLPDALLDQPNPGAYLLDQAIERCKKLKWLRTNLRVVRHDSKSAFTIQGKLIRGDNQCVHMDVKTKTPASADELNIILVGDGYLLAESRKFGSRRAKITTQSMPSRETNDSSIYAPTREKALAERGCAGPRPLVEEARELLTDIEVSRGELDSRPVYRIAGNVDPKHARMLAKQAARFQANRCCVLLDTETLWPVRIEWRWNDQLVLETDYFAATFNQPLTYDECVQYFTLKQESQ